MLQIQYLRLRICYGRSETRILSYVFDIRRPRQYDFWTQEKMVGMVACYVGFNFVFAEAGGPFSFEYE